jgi:hypothetical protein
MEFAFNRDSAGDSCDREAAGKTLGLVRSLTEEVMAYRDIVVYLDVGEDCAARVRTAIDVAAKHQARLIGVDVSDCPYCGLRQSPLA